MIIWKYLAHYVKKQVQNNIVFSLKMLKINYIILENDCKKEKKYKKRREQNSLNR